MVFLKFFKYLFVNFLIFLIGGKLIAAGAKVHGRAFLQGKKVVRVLFYQAGKV